MKKDIIQTLKILLAAAVLSMGISYVYAWTAPPQAPPAGNTPAPLDSGGTPQYKTGKLSIGNSSVPTNALEVYGTSLFGAKANFLDDIVFKSSTGGIEFSDGTKQTTAANSNIPWNSITGKPAGFADNVDNVGSNAWSSITGKPAGFADNVDNVGTLDIVTVSSSGSGLVTATCPAGYVVTGGGVDSSIAVMSRPSGNTSWVSNIGGIGNSGTVYARCARIR